MGEFVGWGIGHWASLVALAIGRFNSNLAGARMISRVATNLSRRQFTDDLACGEIALDRDDFDFA
jgi:hypothetical protein